MKTGAERFFRTSDYWQAWSAVPDLTADIHYALRSIRASDRRVLDVPCGRGRLLKAARTRASSAALFGLDVNGEMVTRVRRDLPGVRAQVDSVYAFPSRDRRWEPVRCHGAFSPVVSRTSAHA